MRTIEICGVAYPFKFGYGALMLAEEVLGRPWGEVVNSRASMVLYMCCFLNASAEFPLDFEGLVDACDGDGTLLGRMADELSFQMERWGKPSEVEGDDKKKD